jgi:ribose transport system permease protein
MSAVLEPGDVLLSRSPARRIGEFVADKGIFVITALVVVVAAIGVDGFLTVPNVVDVFHRASAIGIVAVGMTFVVISANYIDLSVVAQVATSGVILMALSPAGPLVGMLAGLAVSLLIGLVNGLAVGLLRANAVIVTLGTNGVALGLLSLFSKGTIFYGDPHGPVATFGSARLGPVPAAAIVLIVVAIIAQFVLAKTSFGFTIRSVGSNREASRLVGVRAGGVVVGAFLVTAVCSAISGWVLASFSNTAVSTMSDGYDFSALAAVIVGGNSLFGGRGSVVRTLVGVIFIAVVGNILVLVGFSYEWQQLVTGVIIVIAVAADAVTKKAGLR